MKRTPAKKKKTTKTAATKTALARVTAAPDVLPASSVEVLPEDHGYGARMVPGDGGMMIGALGLVEMALSEKEEAVLSRPVRDEDILVKPTGQVYLPWPVLQRWMNDAFGRLGWGLHPVGSPALGESAVVCPYVLYIHGRPVRHAWGEQPYFASNKDQSYGDAVESTRASALRRTLKSMGVGIELWDRAFGDRFIVAHCVRVAVRKKDRSSGAFYVDWQWRRKVDAKFPFELSDEEARNYAQERPAQRVEKPAYDKGQAPAQRSAPGEPGTKPRAAGGRLISEKQAKRLWVIIQNSGRDRATVNAWLEARFGVGKLEAVALSDYDAICGIIEAPGGLPPAGE